MVSINGYWENNNSNMNTTMSNFYLDPCIGLRGFWCDNVCFFDQLGEQRVRMGLTSIMRGTRIQNATIINVHVQNTSANVSRFATHLAFNMFKPKILSFQNILPFQVGPYFLLTKFPQLQKT
jgi:hypothetical protein